MTPTMIDKVAMYKAGNYKFKAPPVCTANWDHFAWIAYIDAYNGWLIPLLQPNNLRNRYRRYKSATKAYGWAAACFRDWVRGAIDIKTAYSAPPNPQNDPVQKTPKWAL